MAKRKVICQYCRNKFDRDEELYEHTSKGYYHKACYDEMIEEKSKRADILEVLDEVTGGKINYALVQKQIKSYLETGKYTESGLLGTLYFAINVRGIKFNPRSGIGILPYLYNDARKYYADQEALANVKKIDYKTVEVVVSPQKTNREKFLIDIESLLEDDSE